MRITRLEQTQAAEHVFKVLDSLDSNDGKEDGKIKASVWNKFVGSIAGTGKKINYAIDKENALKSLRTYLATQNADADLVSKWYDGLSELQIENQNKEAATLEKAPVSTPVTAPVEEKKKPEIPYTIEFLPAPKAEKQEDLPPIPFRLDYKEEQAVKPEDKAQVVDKVATPKKVYKPKPLTPEQKQARKSGDDAAWTLFPYAHIIEPDEYTALQDSLTKNVNGSNVMEFLKGYKGFKNSYKHLQLQDFFQEIHYKYNNNTEHGCNPQDVIQDVANNVLYYIENHKGNKNDINAIRAMLEAGNITEDDAVALDKITLKYIPRR